MIEREGHVSLDTRLVFFGHHVARSPSCLWIIVVVSKTPMDFHLLDLPGSTKVNRFPRSLMVFRGHTDWISPLAISGRKLTSRLDYWELTSCLFISCTFQL